MREGKGEKEFKGNGGGEGIPIMFGQGRHTRTHEVYSRSNINTNYALFVCCPRDPRLHIYLLIGRVVM